MLLLHFVVNNGGAGIWGRRGEGTGAEGMAAAGRPAALGFGVAGARGYGLGEGR